ncbi:MAG: hypothetical protein Fur0037_11590 [Planctomycetota bacterium]
MNGPRAGQAPRGSPPGVAGRLARTAAGAAFLFLLPVLIYRAIESSAESRDSREVAFGSFAAGCLCVIALALVGPRTQPFRPAQWRSVARTYPPFLLVWVGFLLLYLRFMHGIGHPVDPQQGLVYVAERRFDRPGFWLVLATVTAIGPLAEEILFRGHLHSLLRDSLGGALAIVLGAAAFGLVHPPGTRLPIGLLGLLFGWLRERHGSLLPSVIAHAAHNSITVLVTLAWPESLTLLYPR